MKFKKFEKLDKSDKDTRGEPLVMPNKKLIEQKFQDFIKSRNICFNKTDVFNYKFMEEDFKVYVSSNYNKNSFIVNISTIKGKMIHSDAIDISGTTKTAADKIFNNVFKEEYY